MRPRSLTRRAALLCTTAALALAAAPAEADTYMRMGAVADHHPGWGTTGAGELEFGGAAPSDIQVGLLALLRAPRPLAETDEDLPMIDHSALLSVSWSPDEAVSPKLGLAGGVAIRGYPIDERPGWALSPLLGPELGVRFDLGPDLWLDVGGRLLGELYPVTPAGVPLPDEGLQRMNLQGGLSLGFGDR